MHRTFALAGLALGILLSLLPSALTAPSAAESGRADYQVGGVPAYLDLVALRATNGPRQARMELYVRNLSQRGRFELAITHPDRRKGAYARVQKTESGVTTVELRRWKEGGDVDPVITCPRARLTWETGRNRLVFTIPQRCLRSYFKPPTAWIFSGSSSDRIDGKRAGDVGRPLRLTKG